MSRCTQVEDCTGVNLSKYICKRLCKIVYCCKLVVLNVQIEMFITTSDVVTTTTIIPLHLFTTTVGAHKRERQEIGPGA